MKTPKQKILDELQWRFSGLPSCLPKPNVPKELPPTLTLVEAQALAARYLQRYQWCQEDLADDGSYRSVK